MRTNKNQINLNNLSIKGTQTYIRRNFPKLNNNKKKLISLPIINKTLCFTERSALDNHNKALEGFKPKEDKRLRNKIRTKGINNKLNIKYLSLTDRKNQDDILSLLKKIKMDNTNFKNKNNIIDNHLYSYDIYNKDNYTLFNKDYNYIIKDKNYHKIKGKRTKSNNFSQIPKKLNTIFINEPNIINSTIKLDNEKIYRQVKTETNINEENNHNIIIHNIFFEWVKDNIKFSNNDYFDVITNKGNRLSRSFELSINSLKDLNKPINIKNGYYKKVKSANITNNPFNLYENKNINPIINRMKFINKDNIDLKNLNLNTIKDLINSFSKKQYLNTNYMKQNVINKDNDENNVYSIKNKTNLKYILYLKKSNNFLYRFIFKLLLKNNKNNEEIKSKQNKLSKNYENEKDIINKSLNYRYFNSNIKKINNYNVHSTNKSVKIKDKLNVPDLSVKEKVKENFGKKIENDFYFSENSNYKNKANNVYKISKKYYNVALISTPENITNKKKTIIESYHSKKPNNDISQKNKDHNIINNDNNFGIKNSNKNTLIKNLSKKYLNNSSTENNGNNHSNSFHTNDNSNSINSIENNNKQNNNTITFGLNKEEDISKIRKIKLNKNGYNINTSIYKNEKNDILRDINSKSINNSKYQNKDISELLYLKDSKILGKDGLKRLVTDENKNGATNTTNNNLKYETDNTYINNEDKENNVEENTKDNSIICYDKNNKIFNTPEKRKRKVFNNANESKDEEDNKSIYLGKNINFSPKRKDNIKNNKTNIFKKNYISDRIYSYSRKKHNNKNIRGSKNIYISSPKKTKKRKPNTIDNNYYINEDTRQKNVSNTSINSEYENSLENNKKDEINLLENQRHNIYDNIVLTNLSCKKIKRNLELENISSNRNSQRKSKTIKKMINKTSNEKEEESEFELIKLSKEKKKSSKPINSLIDYLNSHKDEFNKNEQLKISYSNFLSEEEIKKLIIYSRKLSELNNKEKTEELIQFEEDLKQKYNEILTRYLINQKYKGLVKEKKINKKKKLRNLYEEKIEEENEEEIEHQLKIKERKKLEDNNEKIKIEESETKEKEEEQKEKRKIILFEDKEEKEKKDLIYDNTYLFKKNKKDKNIVIKKEVLDILQNKNNSSLKKEKERIIQNDNHNNNFVVRLAKRRAKNNKFKLLRKIKINKNRVNKDNLSLFSDVKIEKIEKKEPIDKDKEKLLEIKIKSFFDKIQRFKRNEGDIDLFDFLKNEEMTDNNNINRLLDFTDNIQNNSKSNKSKYNFLSPVKFKTQNI